MRRTLLVRGERSGDALGQVAALREGDRGARRGVAGELVACDLQDEVSVFGRLVVAEHHAARLRGRRCDVPHARRDVTGDGVLAGERDAVPLEHVGGAGEPDARLGLGHGGLALPHVMQALDVAERVLERHAVGEQADVLLELLQRRLGMGAEVAVVGATCEAQDVQGLLQGADVGAMEVGETQVQRAIAQFIGRVDQG